MMRSIRSLMKDKKGVAALEYSILAGLIVLGVVAAVSTTNLKKSIQDVFNGVATTLNSAANPS